MGGVYEGMMEKLGREQHNLTADLPSLRTLRIPPGRKLGWGFVIVIVG